jgi:hypothetical protein
LGDCIALVRFLLVRLHGFDVVLGVGEGDEGRKQWAHAGPSLVRGGAEVSPEIARVVFVGQVGFWFVSFSVKQYVAIEHERPGGVR